MPDELPKIGTDAFACYVFSLVTWSRAHAPLAPEVDATQHLASRRVVDAANPGDAPRLKHVDRLHWSWRKGWGLDVALEFHVMARKATIAYPSCGKDVAGATAFLALLRAVTEFAALLEAHAAQYRGPT